LNNKLFKDRILFVILVVLVRVFMDYAFIEYIAIKWKYMGFFLEINYFKVFISYVLVVVFVFFLKKYNANKISHFFCITLFFTMYLPIGTIYGYMNQSSTFFTVSSLVFLIFVSIIITLSNNKYTIGVSKENIKVHVKLKLVIYTLSIFTFIGMTIQNVDNLNFRALIDLSDVIV